MLHFLHDCAHYAARREAMKRDVLALLPEQIRRELVGLHDVPNAEKRRRWTAVVLAGDCSEWTPKGYHGKAAGSKAKEAAKIRAAVTRVAGTYIRWSCALRHAFVPGS